MQLDMSENIKIRHDPSLASLSKTGYESLITFFSFFFLFFTTGVFFKAEFFTPQDCGQSKFCEVMKDKFPADTKFTLEGKIVPG